MDKYLLSALMFGAGMAFILSNFFMTLLGDSSGIYAGIGFAVVFGYIYYRRLKRG